MPDPVVLVHGFATSSARTWGDNGWLDLLGDVGRRPVPIDLLGHGTADKPHDPEAYEAMESLVAAQLPDGPVDAIGFSLGARVLLTLACDQPERFSRLVLTGVGANLLRTEGSDLILRAIEGDGDPTNPVVQYFAGLAQHPEVDRARAGRVPAIAAPTAHPRAARRRRRSRCSWSSATRTSPARASRSRTPCPTPELVTLRNVDHFATPKDFGCIDAALDFLGAGL